MRYTDKVYVGDEGTVIILDTLIDLSDANIVKVLVKKPDGSETEWGAVLDDERSTCMKYIIQHGDLDISGKYFLQAYVENNVGKWRGNTVILNVHDKFR